MDIPGAIQSVATAISIAKSLRDIDRSIDEAAYKLALADLTENLAEAKLALVEAKDLIASKDMEIKRLVKEFEYRGKTVTKRGFRYEDRGDGTPQGEPFCPLCEKKDGFLILMTQFRGSLDMKCPECKSEYRADTFTYP